MRGAFASDLRVFGSVYISLCLRLVTRRRFDVDHVTQTNERFLIKRDAVVFGEGAPAFADARDHMEATCA